MTDRKFVYISIVITILVCVASHFFIPYFLRPFIADTRVLSEKEVLKGDTDSATKPAHFVIIVEGNTLTVSINREEQIRYTPHDSAKNSYAIGFYYPCKSVDAVLGLPDLQIDY